MYLVKFLISLINLKTIILFTLTYVIYKCIIYHYSRNPQWVKLSNELPGPRVYPIIGTTASLLTGSRAGLGLLLTNYMNIYGPTFRLWIGKYFTVVVSDVNDVEAVLKSPNCMEKPASLPFVLLLGKSLPQATPLTVWKLKRKEYQPFFLKNILLGNIEELNELNNKFVEKMKKEVNGPEFDVEHILIDLSFDTIIKILLNYDVSEEEKKQLDIINKMNVAIARISFQWFFGFSVLQTIVEWFQPVDVIKTKEMAHNFIDKVIDLTRKPQNWSGDKKLTKTETLNRETVTQSFLDKLFELENELNEPDLVHSELLAFILGATESTSITMAFCLLALAAHPEIQEKAYQAYTKYLEMTTD